MLGVREPDEEKGEEGKEGVKGDWEGVSGAGREGRGWLLIAWEVVLGWFWTRGFLTLPTAGILAGWGRATGAEIGTGEGAGAGARTGMGLKEVSGREGCWEGERLEKEKDEMGRVESKSGEVKSNNLAIASL